MTDISHALCAALRRRRLDHFPDAYAGQNTKMCAERPARIPASQPPPLSRSRAHPRPLARQPRHAQQLDPQARRRPAEPVPARAHSPARPQVPAVVADFGGSPVFLHHRDGGSRLAHGHGPARLHRARVFTPAPSAAQVIEWGPRSAPTNAVCPVRALTRPSPNPFAQMRSASTSASCALLSTRLAALEPTLTPPPLRVAGSACRTRARRLRPSPAPLVRRLTLLRSAGVSRMQTSLRRKHRDRVVRRGLGLVIESDVRHRPRLRSHLRLPRSRLSVCACRAAVLRDRRGPSALRQPADEHPVLRAGDLQLRRALRLLGERSTRSQTRIPLAPNPTLCIADLRQLRFQLR